MSVLFSPWAPKRDLELEKLEKFIESYRTMSDRERLAGDWQAVQRDMLHAWKKVRSSYK